MKILLVAGARPNFMKIAPIVRALGVRRSRRRPRTMARQADVGIQGSEGGKRRISELDWRIVHTGQHYDYEMSQAFFDDLEIPKPDYFLEVGSGSHAVQTAKVMQAFEKVCLDEMPDLVVVVGDVNSTLACSIVAKKLHLQIAHVEAGLRSFDRTMPEEINRIVTDSIADYLFVTEESGLENLSKEGVSEDKIHFVGHVMIDNLLFQCKRLKQERPEHFPTYAIKKALKQYIFLTLHRPSNVDDRATLLGICEALDKIASETPIIFPVHPRTERMLSEFGILFAHSTRLNAPNNTASTKVDLNKGIILLPPLGYRESLFLWKDAVMVMTDSGGLQEETTALGVPCLTLRENTERPVTVELGTNSVIGNKKEDIVNGCRRLLKAGKTNATVPPKWDGKAAERIVDVLLEVGRTHDT